ncbi:hypothetical protein NFJ02_41g107800 [Pycnococcus provasolii]
MRMSLHAALELVRVAKRARDDATLTPASIAESMSARDRHRDMVSFLESADCFPFPFGAKHEKEASVRGVPWGALIIMLRCTKGGIATLTRDGAYGYPNRTS